MVGLFILGIIGLIIYNIIDTMPLIINVRCILAYVFGLCALRAMGAYTDKEIKLLIPIEIRSHLK
jgi:hypothetical protein